MIAKVTRQYSARLKRLLTLAAKVLPSYVLFGLALLVSKRRRLWLFSSWMGQQYSDNPKYIFQHLLAQHPGIQPLWITKDRDLLRRMRADGLPVAYAYDPMGLVAQLRAGLVVFPAPATSPERFR